MKSVNFTKSFYLISDFHLFHNNIIKYCNRDFKNIEEMNELILNNWNNTVGDDDYIFFLGDFVIGAQNKYETAQIIYDSLKGKKIYLKGNHDTHLKKFTNIPVIDGPIEIIYRDKKIILNHVPIWNFNRSRYDFHIFGHIHNNIVENSKVDLTRMKNVSVEMVGYKPVHIDDILIEFEKINKGGWK